MFGKELFNLISSVPSIYNNLSSIGGLPNIFPNSSPENTPFPYIIYKINSTNNNKDSIIELFNIIFDVFDYNTSPNIIETIVNSLIEVIDNVLINNSSYYSKIRIRRENFFILENDDPRALQYRIYFTARATRSNWINSILS